MAAAFAQPINKVLAGLGVDPAKGLTDKQVAGLQAKHGKNGNASPSYGDLATSTPRSLRTWTGWTDWLTCA